MTVTVSQRLENCRIWSRGLRRTIWYTLPLSHSASLPHLPIEPRLLPMSNHPSPSHHAASEPPHLPKPPHRFWATTPSQEPPHLPKSHHTSFWHHLNWKCKAHGRSAFLSANNFFLISQAAYIFFLSDFNSSFSLVLKRLPHENFRYQFYKLIRTV